MADISTAVSMARVPILGENGRISDDYIPAAIGENVTKAESAATRAESAATGAEGSASAASQSATQASGSASAASASASQAQQSATTASGAATSAQSAQTAAEAAKTAAAGSAQDAQQSATAAQQSAASVADKYITSAQATTLEPGSQATASVENQVLTIGVPKGDKGDTGEKGDTGTGVPEGGTPGQLLSKTDDGTAWVDPPSGNVLTGTATGYVAHAEDAYAQKPIEVRVKGRTVENASVHPTKLVTAGKNLLPPVSEWSVGDRSYTRYIENRLPVGTQLVGRYGGNPSGLPGNVRMEFREDYASDAYSTELTPWSSTSTAGRGVTVTARDRYICLATAEPADAYFDQMQVQLELGSTATAYEPPNVTMIPLPEVELRGLPNGTCDELVIAQDGTATVERRTQLSGDEVTALPEPTTEQLDAVSLPKLPAPTFNAWHDSQVPSDTTVTYERDVNIAFDNLAKQVAGTASAVAVREASTIKED